MISAREESPQTRREKLPVPLIRQTTDSVECGLASLAMIYAFYGKDRGMNQLRPELITDEIGTYAPQLGSDLLKEGLEVEIIINNPKLIEKSDRNLSQEDLLVKFMAKRDQAQEKAKEEARKREFEHEEKVMEYFVNFMQKGGRVTIKVPNREDLKEEIKKGRPLVVFLTNATLYEKNIAEAKGKDFGYTFHSMVAIGFDESQDTVLINDPYDGEYGGEKEYSMDEFLFAVYSSSLGDLDNGCFMKIKKP